MYNIEIKKIDLSLIQPWMNESHQHLSYLVSFGTKKSHIEIQNNAQFDSASRLGGVGWTLLGAWCRRWLLCWRHVSFRNILR